MLNHLRPNGQWSLICCSLAIATVWSGGVFCAKAHEHGCEAGKGAEESAISFFFGPEALSSVAKPGVVSRTQWGCPDGQGSGWTPQYTTVTHLIVHHSATANTSSDWAAVVRSIWNYHANTRGWGDVGYNYLIDPTGVVYEGRAGGDNVIGAHFSCQNGGTMGVCVLGTFTNSVSPTSAALNSLKQLLAWKAEQRGIDPLGSSYHSGTRLTIPNISGHKNANPSTQACSTTSCPGDNLYAQLPAIRSDVKNLVESATVPTVLARPATSITSSSARIWGRIVTNGGSAIVERRLEWGLSNTWSSFTSNVTVSGSDFFYDLTGLSPSTAYQSRAWARNASGWNSNGPAFFTTIVARPVNDNFSSRFLVGGWSVATNGANVNATKESGEPNHAGNAGGKSVWWSWIAPFSGAATISTAGSSFNTLLGVYTGASVSGLSAVASNDDGGGALTSRTTFNCVAGTAYQIAVDGSGGASGNVALTVTVHPALGISKSGDRIVLSWTNAATGFTLQQADNALTGSWTAVLPTPVVVGGRNTVTNTMSGARKIYRLRKP